MSIIGVTGIEVDVSGDLVPYVPAKMLGDPSDCYPSDGGYCENVRVFLNNNEITNFLTQKQLDSISEELYEESNDEYRYRKDQVW